MPYHSSYLNKFAPAVVLTAAHGSGFMNMTSFFLHGTLLYLLIVLLLSEFTVLKYTKEGVKKQVKS